MKLAILAILALATTVNAYGDSQKTMKLMGRKVGGIPDPGQTTREGCLCKSECGATVDFGNSKYDWCYTQNDCGSWSLTRFSYYDYCVYPIDQKFEAQTASQKLNEVWSNIVADQTSSAYPNQALIVAESVKTSFDNFKEFLPNTRVKYIHSVGYVSKIRFKAAAGSPYTGSFAGSNYGLIRASSAAPLSKSPSEITPGAGIKFFRDGVPSANFFAMPGLDPQSSFNFFEQNFTNHLTNPTSAALKIIAQKFMQASACPLMIGLSDVAKYGENGKAVTPGSIRFPYRIVLVPTGRVTFPTTYYDQKSLQALFAAIPVGTALFNVYVSDSPSEDQSGANTFIGTISTSSTFVASSYGDDKLFFRHTYMEDDFKYQPDWLDQIDPYEDCGTTSVGPDPPAMEN